MIIRRSQTSESFAHVANRVLRGMLESRSGEVEPAQMRQALKRTLAALRRDVITDDPALYRALPARIEAGRAADHALSSGRPARCHRAMLAYMIEALVNPFLHSGQLVRVLEDWSPSFEGLFLYYPGHRQVPAALRAFIDMIKAAPSTVLSGSLFGNPFAVDRTYQSSSRPRRS
jgi:DNA-binding transcriptional LysR family regulator